MCYGCVIDVPGMCKIYHRCVINVSKICRKMCQGCIVHVSGMCHRCVTDVNHDIILHAISMLTLLWHSFDGRFEPVVTFYTQLQSSIRYYINIC